MNTKELETIASRLRNYAEAQYNGKESETFKAYCHGIAYVLDKLGYAIEWDGNNATIKRC